MVHHAQASEEEPEEGLSLPQGCVERCRGCEHRSLTHAQSLHRKSEFLSRVSPVPTAAFLGGDARDRLGYRDKVLLHAEKREGAWILGLRPGRDEPVLDLAQCPVHSARVLAIQEQLTRWLGDLDLPLVYVGIAGPTVSLVLKQSADAALVKLVGEALRPLAGVQALWVHFNPAAGRRVWSPRSAQLVWGERWITGDDGLVFGPQTFAQARRGIHAQALDLAEAFLGPTKNHAVLDLYCGRGDTLRRWTSHGARALGVELGAEAVEAARLNAPSATVLQGRSEDRIPQIREWASSLGSTTRIAAYVNPPRMGLGPGVGAFLAEELPGERLAYLSCSPASLSRDLQVLAQSFVVESVQGFDFFPGTRQVEALALLRRRDPR